VNGFIETPGIDQQGSRFDSTSGEPCRVDLAATTSGCWPAVVQAGSESPWANTPGATSINDTAARPAAKESILNRIPGAYL